MDLFILKTWLDAKFDRHDEAGATLVEYGLLVALIAVVAIVAIRLLGSRISRNFSNVGNTIRPAPAPPGARTGRACRGWAR